MTTMKEENKEETVKTESNTPDTHIETSDTPLGVAQEEIDRLQTRLDKKCGEIKILEESLNQYKEQSAKKEVIIYRISERVLPEWFCGFEAKKKGIFVECIEDKLVILKPYKMVVDSVVAEGSQRIIPFEPLQVKGPLYIGMAIPYDEGRSSGDAVLYRRERGKYRVVDTAHTSNHICSSYPRNIDSMAALEKAFDIIASELTIININSMFHEGYQGHFTYDSSFNPIMDCAVRVVQKAGVGRICKECGGPVSMDKCLVCERLQDEEECDEGGGYDEDDEYY